QHSSAFGNHIPRFRGIQAANVTQRGTCRVTANRPCYAEPVEGSHMDSPNRKTEAARLYHEVTKHSYTSVRTDGHVLDWDNRPFPFKIYPHAAALSLPRDLQLPSTPTLETISETTAAHADTPLDLERLTRILFSAAGLTRKRRVGMEDYHFRAAASAGALYPIEIYLAGSSD